ncbi:unnamed protein product, partial [Ceratitis capitata]
GYGNNNERAPTQARDENGVSGRVRRSKVARSNPKWYKPAHEAALPRHFNIDSPCGVRS